jgi:hypothetical protein
VPSRRVSRAAVAALAAALAALAAPAAHADTLEVPAPGARNLGAAGGFLVWAEPSGDGAWRLAVRAPSGRVTRPQIPSFAAPPEPTVGSGPITESPRRLLALYSRCTGASTLRGCDVHALDLRTGREEVVERLATRTSSEVSASTVLGALAAIRRGGPRPGVVVGRRGSLRRVIARTPLLLRTSGARLALLERDGDRFDLTIRRISGRPPALPVLRDEPRRPHGVVLDTYRLTYLLGDEAFQTARIPGPSRTRVAVLRGDRPLPRGTSGVEVRGSLVRRALTPEGLVRLSPAVRFR